MNRASFCIYLFLHIGFISAFQIKAIEPYYSDSSRYDVTSYALNLKLSNENTKISGFTSISAICLQKQLNTLFLELNPELDIDSILFEGKPCSFSRNEKWLKINLSSVIAEHKQFSFSIYYNGEVISTTEMGGFLSEYSSLFEQKVTYTLSEPFAAYLWFPCKQELSDKADSIFVNITVREGLKVASNGVLKKIVSLPDSNAVRFEWASYYPTAYYLIALAVAEYKEYSYYIKNLHNNDSLFFQNFMFDLPEYTNYSKASIDKTVDIMHVFEKLLVPFPFSAEKYGHCLAPISGGMENQTITTVYNFSFALIAHELAHSWFGNMVTCSTWKDIWVNEGIASYFEYLAMEQLDPEKAESWLLEASDRALSEPNGTVCIPDSELTNERRIFDYSLTYKKGAIIVHQMREKFDNDSLFFLALRTYLQRFRYANATVRDFKNVMEDVRGINLDKLFNSWYYGYGMPQIFIQWNYEQSMLLLSAIQKNTSLLSPVFDVTYDLLVTFIDGTDTLIRFNQQWGDENFNIPLTKAVKSVHSYKESSRIVISSINSNELKYSELQLFPNPAKDTVHLVFPNFSANRKVELITTNGYILASYSTPEKQNEIRINLLKGLYILRVIENGSATSVKFLKE